MLDVGAGNGALTAVLALNGYHVTAVEPSSEGISQAKKSYPKLNIEKGSAYEDLVARFGHFDAIVSCEVIEHLLTPGQFFVRAREALKPDAVLIVSTPYHAYLKNVLIALSGKWDFHHHPNREFGHVKFFARKTLRDVATANGLEGGRIS